MKEITQIRSLSLWIFLVPFIAINTCLLISVNYFLFENTFFTVDQIGRSGFTIPYLDGSLSISRASRTFPQYLIFKPGMAITAILLCFYWYKNNLLINYFNSNIFKLKILLVSLLVFIAIISVPLLIVDKNVHFKHGLEWNYFIGIILFYLLTNFFWKKKK